MSAPDVDIDMNDLAALRKAAPRKTGGATVKSRAAREKPALSPMDGRSHKPSSERGVALNVDVPHEIKQLVNQARVTFGLPYKTFVAEAIKHYYRHLEIEAQSETP